MWFSLSTNWTMTVRRGGGKEVNGSIALEIEGVDTVGVDEVESEDMKAIGIPEPVIAAVGGLEEAEERSVEVGLEAEDGPDGAGRVFVGEVGEGVGWFSASLGEANQ